MKVRLALAALLPVCALAQLQTVVVDGGVERPLGLLYDVGSVWVGEPLEVRFRVRNVGTAPANLQTIGVVRSFASVAAGFFPGIYPALPCPLAPGATVDFTVRFAPEEAGAFSASLTVNVGSAILQGRGVAPVLVVAGGVERPLGALYDVGLVWVGDTLDVALRIRNAGKAAINLQTISVAGAGFSLNYPPLPYVVAPGASVDFTVRFAPGAAGAFPATLAVNGATAILRGTGVATPAVLVERDDGSTLPLRAGDALDFGRIERGGAVARRVRIENRSGGYLRITTIRIEGQAFSASGDLPVPALLDNGQSVRFEVRFSPQTAGLAEGSFEIDGRRFVLRGTGTEIPFPRPAIRIQPGVTASAQQGQLRIEFAEPSRAAGAGTLSVEFRSGVLGVAADPYIFFLPPSSRFAQFTVKEGDTRARFGDRDDITFQTGTTAGTLVFTARLGDVTEQLTAPVAPAPVGFDSVKALRSGSQIEVQIVGYDNVRTVSQMTFTFYDARDAALSPGPIKVDLAAKFRDHFETTAVGGAFALRVVFPIVGQVSDVVSLEVDTANSAGPTRSSRLRLP
ncbi:MAG: choice-of-anchor D domain-containing protein [Acidobacteriota bacterium]